MPQIASPQFEEVVTAELPVMYRVARRLTLDAVDAEDLVGQVLFLAAKSWSAFDGEHPRSWLLKILRNEHLSGLRRKAVRPQTVPLDRAQAAAFEQRDTLGAAEIGSQLIEELDKLPEEYRLAVAFCDVEEMTYEDAAAAMDVPIGTVRSRLYRGRQMLRERLGEMCI